MLPSLAPTSAQETPFGAVKINPTSLGSTVLNSGSSARSELASVGVGGDVASNASCETVSCPCCETASSCACVRTPDDKKARQIGAIFSINFKMFLPFNYFRVCAEPDVLTHTDSDHGFFGSYFAKLAARLTYDADFASAFVVMKL
jgi:hypothetical protein